MEGLQFAPAAVPEFDGATITGTGEGLPISCRRSFANGGKTHAQDTIRMALEGLQFAPAAVPEFDGAISTGTGEGLTIGGKTHATDPIGMAFQGVAVQGVAVQVAGVVINFPQGSGGL